MCLNLRKKVIFAQNVSPLLRVDKEKKATSKGVVECTKCVDCVRKVFTSDNSALRFGQTSHFKLHRRSLFALRGELRFQQSSEANLRCVGVSTLECRKSQQSVVAQILYIHSSHLLVLGLCTRNCVMFWWMKTKKHTTDLMTWRGAWLWNSMLCALCSHVNCTS